MWSWQNYAMGIIEDVARHKEFFTSDDVQEALTVKPAHPNQLGAAFEAAKTKGYITSTKTIVASERKAAKGRNIQVWQSLLYKQPTLFEMEPGDPLGEMSRNDYSRPKCKTCKRPHNRRDAFSQHTERCDSCARKDVVSGA